MKQKSVCAKIWHYLQIGRKFFFVKFHEFFFCAMRRNKSISRNKFPSDSVVYAQLFIAPHLPFLAHCAITDNDNKYIKIAPKPSIHAMTAAIALSELSSITSTMNATKSDMGKTLFSDFKKYKIKLKYSGITKIGFWDFTKTQLRNR